MEKTQHKWRSPSLGKDMTIRVYGDSGTPVIGFPTRGQDSDQWEAFGMVDAVSTQVENGYNQLFCVDTVDEESLMNKKVDASRRLMRYGQYETYIMEEVVPFVQQHSSNQFLMVAGVDMGGYHAMNLALKHPESFDKVIGMSGLYNVKNFFGGFYSETLYYNNPLDYMPNLTTQPLLGNIRELDIRLVSYTNDARKHHAEQLARIFRTKFIDHELDVWDLKSDEEWDLWKKMLKTHII